MKIPREFEREMFMFISAEIQTGDPIHSPVQLAERCGAFCRRWFGMTEQPMTYRSADLAALVSWSERFGKHVGEFFLNYKEG
jgi:hypothetical protein